LPIRVLTCVLSAMLPDNMCKCKTRCTFIRFVHRSPYRRTGATRQLKRIQTLAHHLLSVDYSE
jgi:hypothetical protein